METSRSAVLGFGVQAAMHVGFVIVNLAMFSQPGYAFASALLALASLLAAFALRHGWEDHVALLVWSTMAAAAIATLRWGVAEVGQPLDPTSPLAALLPVGHVVVAVGSWRLWRGVDPTPVRALRWLASGAVLLAAACLGFAAYAFAFGGWAIGSCLVFGVAGTAALAWAAHREAAATAPAPPRAPTRSSTLRP